MKKIRSLVEELNLNPFVIFFTLILMDIILKIIDYLFF